MQNINTPNTQYPTLPAMPDFLPFPGQNMVSPNQVPPQIAELIERYKQANQPQSTLMPALQQQINAMTQRYGSSSSSGSPHIHQV